MKTESLLDIMGNTNRRKILSLLSREPHYISQIARKLEVTQPAVLRHLNILQRSGLIESFTRKNPLGAARKYYKICDSFALEIALDPETFDVKELPQRTTCMKYLDTLKTIEELTNKINATDDIELKASKAHEMMALADTLLSCEEYDEEDLNCVNCQTVANLKKKVTKIIIDVARGNIRSGLKTLNETVSQISRLPFTRR